MVLTLNTSAQSIHGTYNYGKASTGYGLLKIHEIDVNHYRFYLEIGRGAPSYNSGALYGTLKFDKKTKTAIYLPASADDCRLELKFTKNKIIVKTVGGDCGFGGGVYADAVYNLRDNKNPSFLISRANKKIYFDKTPPEKFREDN